MHTGPTEKQPRSAESSRSKGDIVEDIVALLYQSDEWDVAKRVFLPSIDGSGATSEIDVLISRPLAGKPMHVAVECKNYKERVSKAQMGSFISKLRDVGIPPQNGVFVCVNGYEAGALRLARNEGIRTLRLEGLTADRLQAQVHAAFQSVIYLLLDVTGANEPLWFYGKNGELNGSIFDLVWASWRDGRLPTKLGEHEPTIKTPSYWNWSTNGYVPYSAKVRVQITGVVVTQTGEARSFQLKEAESGISERFKVEASFDRAPGSRTLPVQLAQTEEELQRLLDEPVVARISTGRVRLPRIRVGPVYWPPSQQALQVSWEPFRQRLRDTVQWSTSVGTADFSSLFAAMKTGQSFADLEGTDLSAMWEPIAPFHPGAKDLQWPFKQRRRIANPTVRRRE